MAGVNVDGGGGKGRRALDSDINMIPMIDLLMVTISFLLITAVWVHSQRMDADAQVPGPATTDPPCTDCKEDAKLHVETSDPTKFVLAWKQGRTVVKSTEIPRGERAKSGPAYPDLAAKIRDEWAQTGVHRDATDTKFDKAVVHATNDMAYSDLIGVMDAVSQPKRGYKSGSGVMQTNAFDVTFASD